MDNFLSVRSELYDHFQASQIREVHFLAPGNADIFAQYDVAMYLLQDSAEAIWAHMRRGFARDPLAAYLEFWGVMQAVIIHQDALSELHQAVTGAGLRANGPAAKALRNLRNVSAGHPARKTSGRSAPLRAFMGRQPKSYEYLTYELWDAATETTSFPSVALGPMIEAYDLEAAASLRSTLAYMRRIWPVESGLR